MHWTKIPTNILIERLTDQEIVSIVKYQLLWADLEYKPEDKKALRYLTNKQLIIAKQWCDSIEAQVISDIRSCETNRNKRKTNYLKNKENKEIVTGTLPDTVPVTLQEQIRGDKNRIDNNTPYNPPMDIQNENQFEKKEKNREFFEEFWLLYPRQRRGNKEKAFKAYYRVLKDGRATPEKLLEAAKDYSVSDEVRRGYAKGCEAWLNDDRFNIEYKKQEQEWMI